MSKTDLLVLVVPMLIPLTVLALIVRETWRSVQPARLMLRGLYAESREASVDLGTSWMRWIPGVRPTTPYMLALAHHLEGDLEETERLLRSLERGEHGPLDVHMTFAMQSLEAANLTLQQSDPDRVLRLLAATAKVQRFVRDDLMEAIALHALGRDEEAEARFRAAGTDPRTPKARLGKIVLFWDEELEAATFHTLRGMYLRQTGRETEAVAALLRASAPYQGDQTNVYVEGARRLLADATLAAPAKDADALSSLAPQVVESFDA